MRAQIKFFNGAPGVSKNRPKGVLAVFLLALTVAITFAVIPRAVFSSGASLSRISGNERPPRFIDDEGLLTAEQAAELNSKLDEISERHQFDAVIAVVTELGYGPARLYAVDFYEQNGFGFGEDLDGAILLLAMRDRDFGFASVGFGLKAFTPAGQEYLDKLFLPQIRENEYYGAFMAYADAIDDFLTKAESGRPYDKGNIPLTASERADYRRNTIIISVALALVAAFVVTFIWRLQLKSVRSRNYAREYIRGGSMVVNVRRDIFLYRNVHKERKPQESGGGGGGGGSRGGSFSSSSGRSSTGHSGKF